MAPWTRVLRFALAGAFAASAAALSPRHHVSAVAGPAAKSQGGLASRRQWLYTTFPASLAVVGSAVAGRPGPAAALVKGSAPPPKTKKAERGSCKTMDECEAVGVARSDELFADSADGAPVLSTPEGDRYKDLIFGTGPAAARGSEVTVKYRVLRLGKRSRDGLSGEASPIFSLGYGEDDDKETDVTSFKVGQGNVVAALDAALLGMQRGGRRRVNVRPARGWKLPDSSCLKVYTDMAVVPGTQVQENDACFADDLLPKPSNYGAKRRMLRRYDETLIVELDLVDTTAP